MRYGKYSRIFQQPASPCRKISTPMPHKRHNRVNGNSIWLFHLCDYRHQRGSFDRIVSVGMLEHAGTRHFDSYFVSIARLLMPNGVALAHLIGVHHNAKRYNRWLNQYIFPRGYIPALEQMTRAAGRQELKIFNMEIMRRHYAETLKQWRQTLHQNIATVCQDYDERFINM